MTDNAKVTIDRETYDNILAWLDFMQLDALGISANQSRARCQALMDTGMEREAAFQKMLDEVVEVRNSYDAAKQRLEEARAHKDAAYKEWEAALEAFQEFECADNPYLEKLRQGAVIEQQVDFDGGTEYYVDGEIIDDDDAVDDLAALFGDCPQVDEETLVDTSSHKRYRAVLRSNGE